jgi:hypothetical protein
MTLKLRERPELLSIWLDMTPMGRLGEASEVATAVVYLASAEYQGEASRDHGAGHPITVPRTLVGNHSAGSRIFAVGTRVISRPPHRSVRAAFPHTAPTSGV